MSKRRKAARQDIRESFDACIASDRPILDRSPWSTALPADAGKICRFRRQGWIGPGSGIGFYFRHRRGCRDPERGGPLLGDSYSFACCKRSLGLELGLLDFGP
jgi:hypothetical protein